VKNKQLLSLMYTYYDSPMSCPNSS
jgi:hypothetical protein